MNKTDRFGMECELSALQQYAHMIQKELRKKKSDLKKIDGYILQMRNNIGFIDYHITQGILSK